jgi:hypothetical protein
MPQPFSTYKKTKKSQRMAIFLDVIGQCSLDLFSRFQVAEPTHKGSVIEKQKKGVSEPPVCLKCLLRTTGQATIAPNALITQDRIRLQRPALSPVLSPSTSLGMNSAEGLPKEPALSPSKGDIVHRTFVDTPPTLITLDWVRFWLWHQKTQQCVPTGQPHQVVETPPGFRASGLLSGSGPERPADTCSATATAKRRAWVKSFALG